MGRRKDQAQFNMRLDRPLLKRLQNAAKDQDRSLNSEMVHRLEQSFVPSEDRIPGLRNLFDEMFERIKAEFAKSLEIPGELSDLASVYELSEREASADAPMSDYSPREAATADTHPATRGVLDHLVREAERNAARRRLSGARLSQFDPTDEQLQAMSRLTVEGYRRNAKRHEARGAHEKAVEMLELAARIERDIEALTRGQVPHQTEREPELPMGHQEPRRKIGG
jgi:Arc-like DNA binding domain